MLLVLSVLLSLSSADMLLFLLAGVFCCWYRLPDMLLLLLMLMDHFMNRTKKGIGLIGLASDGGSNEDSTASSRQRWMSNLYISCSSFSIKAGMDSEILLRSVPKVFSSPSLLGMIQAFNLGDQIMGSHAGEAS